MRLAHRTITVVTKIKAPNKEAFSLRKLMEAIGISQMYERPVPKM